MGDLRDVDRAIAREAKAIVALAFKNGPIEQVHAGRSCRLPNLQWPWRLSRITDDEMKGIMTNAVNVVYKLLVLKSENPEEYDRQIKFGTRYTTRWMSGAPGAALNGVTVRRPDERRADVNQTGRSLPERPLVLEWTKPLSARRLKEFDWIP
ncbi:MAG: hypothetical protein ACRD3S_20460 [Terracidiphilus sp.]